MFASRIAYEAAVCGALSIIWDVLYTIFQLRTTGMGQSKWGFFIDRLESVLHSLAFVVLLQTHPLPLLMFFEVAGLALVILWHQLDAIPYYISSVRQTKKIFLTVFRMRQPTPVDWYMASSCLFIFSFAFFSSWEIWLIWQLTSLGRPL